jgi:LytR cell envelope-related transcriptional attenuator
VSVATPGGEPPSRPVSPLRGVALVVVAVLIGILLLKAGDDSSSADDNVQATGPDDQTSQTTTQPGGSTGSSETTVTVPQTHPPNEVKVLVLNGSGVQGAAGKVANTLKAENYVATADNAGTAVNATTVYFQPGYEGDAKAIADLLKNPAPATAAMPNPPPSTKVGDNKVVVVLAADVAATAR